MDDSVGAAAAVDLSDGGALLVRLGRQIKAPAARVWAVLSDPGMMQQWLGPRTFEAQPGGRVLFDVLHGARPDGAPQRWLMFGNIVCWEPERELAFTWQEFDVPELTAWPAATTVSICLEPRDAGTFVTLSHSGFEHLPDALEQFSGYQQGWASLNDLAELARLCEENDAP